MRLLAFETATRWLSVALWQDGHCLEQRAELPNSGSEVLLPWAHALLAEAGTSLAQLDGIAFGAGPGGFTGLRLACGLAQGLAAGLDKPVVPVGTLAALALNAGDGPIWTLLDARMNEVYAAAYQVTGSCVEERMAPCCVAPGPGAVPPKITFAGTALRAAGDGFLSCAALLRESPGVTLLADVWPSAAAVARLAAPRLAAGQGVDAALAQPQYVRDKIALTTAERRARGGLR